MLNKLCGMGMAVVLIAGVIMGAILFVWSISWWY